MGVPELRLFIFLVAAILIAGLILVGVMRGLNRKDK